MENLTNELFNIEFFSRYCNSLIRTIRDIGMTHLEMSSPSKKLEIVYNDEDDIYIVILNGVTLFQSFKYSH
jgi:hypothetical protein